MNRSIKLNHNQIRYLLIPPLALALVHFVMYKKFPFDPGYQFPLIPFLTVVIICAVCCEANTYSYLKLSRKLSLVREPALTILKQVTRSLALTTVIFAVIVYAINYFVFNTVSPLSRFLSSLFVAWLLMSVETLIYIIRDFRLAHKALNQNMNQQARQWLVQSGNRTISLKSSDVAYVYSQKGLVYVVTHAGEKHLSQFNSINELSEQFGIQEFFRLNRQYLISTGAVAEIQKEVNQKLKVLLTPVVSQLPKEATVSRYTSPEFKKWIKN